MKIKFHNIVSYFFNILLVAILPIGYEIYQNIQEKNAILQADNQAKTNQIIERNEVINRHYNELNQLVIEREICETTQEVIIEENKSEIKLYNEALNEYEQLIDEISESSIEAIKNVPLMEISNNIRFENRDTFIININKVKLEPKEKKISRIKKLFVH